MNRFFITLVFVVVVLFVGSVEVHAQWSCPAQWQCPANCSCVNNEVSVACFEAYPNDNVNDSANIQCAFNLVPDNWKIYFPSGRYLVAQPLYINRSNVTLYGDGITSELYTPQNTSFQLLNIPQRNLAGECNPQVIPKNILIERLSFSGDLNPGAESTGIMVWNGEDILIKDILVRDFNVEGISISNGFFIPKNITLERVRTQRIRRNGLHLGYGENIVIKDSSIENSQDSVWGPNAGNAIDLEVEGTDKRCTPEELWFPYLYNTSITNTLVISRTTEVSHGGIAVQPAYGPIRKLSILNNVLINSAGISSIGKDQFVGTELAPNIDPRMGRSLRNRDLDISSNWVSNLHYPGGFADFATVALTVFASGGIPDPGTNAVNDIKLNNNVLTVYIVGGNNYLFEFGGVHNLSGNNNETYRPFQVLSDPINVSHNFLWRKVKENVTTNNDNLRLTNTLDNGWTNSRLLSYDPPNTPQYSFEPFDGSTLAGTPTPTPTPTNSLTWDDNPYSTPSNPPTIGSVFAYGYDLHFSVNEPNNLLPVRVMVLHNGLPLGLKDAGTTASILLNRQAKIGDVFVVRAFNHNGQYSERTCTYVDDPRFFVEQHYRDFLEREADTSGADYWTSQITACGSNAACLDQKRVDVARAFWYAPEFLQLHPGLRNPPGVSPDFDNREFVRLCYVVYLRREPDQAGWDMWTNELNNDIANGVGYDHLIAAFIRSPEYRARFGGC